MRRVLISLFTLAVLPLALVGDCGLPLEYYGYEFLNPAISRLDSRFLPYIGGFETLYDELDNEDWEQMQQTDNIDEWYERYCEGVEKQDLVALIYGDSERRLQALRRAIADPESRLSDLEAKLRTNSFARHLMKYRCGEVVDYLLYAKKIEPHVTAPRNTFAKKPPSGNAMKRLVEEGLAIFPTVESHYLRLRYAYQLLRLSHYRGDYAHVLELHEYLMPKIDADPSLIYYWIDGHYAGALLGLGRRIEAAYLYSRIFINCPSKRESAYRSFSIRTDDEWKELLLLCKSDRERADLYVLRAQNDRALLLDEMRAIYALDPDNEGLEMLTVREIKQLEMDFLANDLNPRRRANLSLGIPRPDARQRLIDLQQFVLEVAEADRGKRPEFWELARGYLHLLAGDFHYARRAFWTVAPALENDTLQQQLNIMRRVLDIMAITELNDSLENAYFKVLANEELLEKYPDLDNLIYDKFRDVYRDNGEYGKAFLLTHKLRDLRYNLDIDLLREFHALAVDTNDNSFERRLLLERGGPNAVNDLIDMEATYYLQRGQLRLANKVFRQMPEENWNDYGNYAPFKAYFDDRVNRRLPDTLQLFNKAEMFQQVLDLEERADLSPEPNEAARLYYGVGLAYYNMSYFGYNWRAADYFRSGENARRAANGQGNDFVFTTRQTELDNYEHMSMELARYYFEQARKKTLDPERGARYAYWAAKTERNQYYADGMPGGQRPFGYFQLLTDYYDDTEYYRKIIEECRTFAWFTGNLSLDESDN
ncbi:hypothetical protein CEQ90_08395 [Lewinellaceae bacterium SD302]|nr:hypothetical protein CEQ90_08395 [Lewinellaceae bacterium SD302]